MTQGVPAMVDVYRLEFEIPKEALRTMARGCRIAIARACGSAPPNVIWTTVEPARRHTVTWETVYGVHASALPTGHPDRLRILDALFPARERTIYPFSAGAFRAPSEAARVPSGHFDIRNDGSEALMFGLVAEANVDGERRLAPLNAVIVPANFTADFSTGTDVFVWLQPEAAVGTTVAAIPPCATVLGLVHRRPVARLRYDESSAGFVCERVSSQ